MNQESGERETASKETGERGLEIESLMKERMGLGEKNHRAKEMGHEEI